MPVTLLTETVTRCAVMCQLRITELQDLARAKKNGEKIKVLVSDATVPERTIKVITGDFANSSKVASRNE
jgi:hypothetical protein